MNHYKDNFTLVPNQIIDDKRLTWKAKGIFTQLVSMDTNSHVSINMLTDLSSDGRSAVRTGVQELIKYGYLDRYRIDSTDMYNGGWQYVVKLPS